jgi:GDP-4-dehydro-6-deoxy-D-mannose reductase
VTERGRHSRRQVDRVSILVTGAGGFAGSHLVDLLVTSGAGVTGWRRRDVDLLDRAAVARALAELRPTTVFHCAGAAHVAHSWGAARETLATNVLGTHHLLDGLRVAGLASRVLIPGSSLVYRQSEHALTEDDPTGPASPYALSKLAQEMLGLRGIDEDRQQVFLTRSFNHIGPRQDPSYAAPGFARQIALIEKGRIKPEIEVGNLDASRDLTDVRDTVRAYREILERGRSGVIYNVCSGYAYKIREVLDRLVALSRVPVTVRIDPARYRPNDNPLLLGDPGRIQRELGWHPSISLDRTLSDLLDYWRKEVESNRKRKSDEGPSAPL